ncbi:MAG: hypothetical protein WC595_06575 [Candidatus Nanoarchaeia archaeon]
MAVTNMDDIIKECALTGVKQLIREGEVYCRLSAGGINKINCEHLGEKGEISYSYYKGEESIKICKCTNKFLEG